MAEEIQIRRSRREELTKIMHVYEAGKAYMRKEGNMSQWVDGYPSEEVILNDISNGNHYIMERGDGRVLAVFSFIIGDDPTYSLIEKGEWLNHSPYGTIHRIATTGIESGMLAKCVAYCFSLIPNIRIDTHEDNRSMLNAITRLGFQRCGIIYTSSGSPRVAFQKVLLNLSGLS